jgi:hypothetical protein
MFKWNQGDVLEGLKDKQPHLDLSPSLASVRAALPPRLLVVSCVRCLTPPRDTHSPRSAAVLGYL